MIKKLSKHGNSWAILIDKPMLELLSIDEHTRIDITTDGTNIIIKPMHSEKHKLLYEELNQTIDAFLKKKNYQQ